MISWKKELEGQVPLLRHRPKTTTVRDLARGRQKNCVHSTTQAADLPRPLTHIHPEPLSPLSPTRTMSRSKKKQLQNADQRSTPSNRPQCPESQERAAVGNRVEVSVYVDDTNHVAALLDSAPQLPSFLTNVPHLTISTRPHSIDLIRNRGLELDHESRAQENNSVPQARQQKPQPLAHVLTSQQM